MITQSEYLLMQARLNKGKTLAQACSDRPGPERRLHNQIIEFCKPRRWLVIHSRMDCPTTQMKGVPDFIILADRGRLLLVECKARGGKPTIDQLAFGIMAETLGHKVHLVYSLKEFVEVVNQNK